MTRRRLRPFPSDVARPLFRAPHWSRRDQHNGKRDEKRPRDERERELERLRGSKSAEAHKARGQGLPGGLPRPPWDGPAYLLPSPEERSATAARESSRAAPPAGDEWDYIVQGAAQGSTSLALTGPALPSGGLG